MLWARNTTSVMANHTFRRRAKSSSLIVQPQKAFFANATTTVAKATMAINALMYSGIDRLRQRDLWAGGKSCATRSPTPEEPPTPPLQELSRLHHVESLGPRHPLNDR